LQDDAGQDYRRSRSGANNIVPNATPALFWIQRCLPELNGRLTGYALNVPVQAGSMLDLDISLSHPIDDVSTLRELFLTAEKGMPSLIETTSDPVVSSDVKGRSCSLLVDLQGMSRSGRRLVKVLGWHETLGHAQRMLEVAQLYHQLSSIDSKLSE
jgi:glyceraldehyde 3-phosphate dehydrogenase